MKRTLKPIQLIYASIFSSIIFVFTYIGVQIPAFGAFGGLTHMGTLLSFVISIKYGKYYGSISGALGMTLFDLLSPWTAYAPATFIIRLISGYIFGLLAESSEGQGKSIIKNFISLILGGLTIVIGYFVFESIFLNLGWAALRSIPGNILQIIIASFGLFIFKSMPDLRR
jgi:uncharacterized membrane protein